MSENKMKQQINNVVNDNLEALKQLFPSAVKDGQVDFEALKEELGQFEEVKDEKYEFRWAGKQNAKKAAQTDVGNRTLKYIPEDSKDADTTQNLYIEGDNLEVLKLLRQNYYGAIKMIYIDPPYNTGNDFIYNDNFSMSKEENEKAENCVSEDGERLQKNPKEGNSKYHTKWLNMMYPRLKVARDLLTDDGVIFISIDDNEQANLKKICDEIFGEGNFDEIIWQKMDSQEDRNTNSKVINRLKNIHEKILVLYKNKDDTIFNKMMKLPDWKKQQKNIDKDPRGPWMSGIISFEEGHENEDKTSEYYYELQSPSGKKIMRHWFYLKDELEKLISDNRIYFPKNGEGIPRIKVFENEEKDYYMDSILRKVGTSSSAKDELEKIFENRMIFDTPKPVKALTEIVRISTRKKDIILDFFSGSSTAAHAVMKLNSEDNGNRKFIMVQLPELTYTGKKDENKKYIIDKITGYPIVAKNNKGKELDSEARKNGYYTITEIGKERIRRAGEKIKEEIEKENSNLKLGEEPKKVPDIGFKVFRVDDTNIRWKEMEKINETDILSSPDMLDFKIGTKDIDVVYELMLRQPGVPLSETLEKLTEIGNRTYLYAASYLVCLETEITEKIIEKIAEINPLPFRFIFRDSAFGDNIRLKDEIFRRLRSLIEKNFGSGDGYRVEFI